MGSWGKYQQGMNMTLEGNQAICFNLKDQKYVENNGEVDNNGGKQSN